MSEQTNKAHRKPKKEKKPRPAGSENPKAHAFANPGRLQRDTARSHDQKEKRLHVPLVDRLPEEAPPLVVGVVGPPQVGKTTLIKSLIRRYTKQTLSNPTGPLTVVTSKRRRLTFLECPAESLAAMIDIAKVVDIVLLMIDGKYGFEMETMEFLNVLSASGMPGNVFGILTHLDLFKKQDTLRAQKKRLKHRFWSELYQGAKLFYLSGVVNGRYPDREILNLSRFLSVMKNPRPLIWRNSHPYALTDRFLDITPPVDIEASPKCDRTVALYGYLRGTNFPAEGGRVHVPGIGDLTVSDVEALQDPCPTPHMKQAIEKATGKSGRKRLGEKERLLFAPMSDVGGVLVDKDAVYIDVKSNTWDRGGDDNEDRGLGEQMMLGLQGDRTLLGGKEGGVRLFGDGTVMNGVNGVNGHADTNGPTRVRRPIDGESGIEDPEGVEGSNSELDENMSSDIDDNEEDENSDGSLEESDGGVGISRADRASEDTDGQDHVDLEEDAYGSATDYDDLSDEDADALRWKTNLSEKAQAMHRHRVYGRTADLARLMYDDSISPDQALRKWRGAGEVVQEADDAHDEDDEFFKQKKQHISSQDLEDRMIPDYDYTELEAKWQDSDVVEELRQRFATTRLAQGDGAHGEEDEDDLVHDEDLDEDEGDGDFEDLEAEEGPADVQASKPEVTLEDARDKNARRKEELKLRFEEEDREGFGNDKANARREGDGNPEEEFGEDDWYDAQKSRIQKQLDINRAEFAELDDVSRSRVEGFRAGTYARIVLTNVPYEFSAFFNPRMPLVIGGLSPTEDRFGFLQVRIKRHRWHQKILKSNDPLIFSLGWRRFQSLPIYTTSDSRTRNRMLKYTPEHMHCFGTFYGPLIAPNTGFCAVQGLSQQSSGFRISATGVVTSVDESVEIVKKLKLKGHPAKVYKNTAIIKDMFASELEVAKFKSANIKTVSGIRGQIKGRAGAQFPDGYVRAGFEDKILMSDIVFLSTWRYIKPREFYNPVTNLLLPQKKPTTKAQPESDKNPNTTPLGNRDDDGQVDDADIDRGSFDWTGMRLTGAIRAAQDIRTPSNPSSTYRSIDRPTRHFNPLRIPRNLLTNLPFKSQPTPMAAAKKTPYVQRRAVVLGGEEKKARDLMQKVMTVRNDKVAKRREAQEKRKLPYKKRVADGEEKKKEREKRESQDFWRREGRKRASQESGGGGKRRKT